ncbi:MAG TPA: hypothetical protein VLA97_16655, partial [Nocardioidaceae bacterium]|nr:hypothetical protein [Nocardioidaceae bacterium]
FLVGGEAGTAPEPEPAAPPSVVATPTEPGPTGAAPSEQPSEQPSEPSDGVVTDRQRADVDGDGRPDEVRVLLHGSTPDEPATGTVEVTLASGATGAAEMPFGYPPRLLPAFDVNGDGREQVLMSHTAGGDSAQLLVYTWHEDGLVQAEVEGDAPLALELDGQGTVAHYYVDDRGLFSWRRLDPVDLSGGSRFTVEQWKWSVEGDRLRPTPSAEGCVDVTGTEPPGPC